MTFFYFRFAKLYKNNFLNAKYSDPFAKNLKGLGRETGGEETREEEAGREKAGGEQGGG